VRIDAGVVEGDTVSIFYDPMIAKLVVWDEDRPRALSRLRDALAACDVVGPKSNVAFLERLVRHRSVVDGSIDTGYLDRHLDEFMPAPDADPALVLAAATAVLLAQEAHSLRRAGESSDPHSPWAVADGWRLGHAGRRPLAFLHRGQRVEVSAQGSGGDYRIALDGNVHEVEGARLTVGALSVRIDRRARRFAVMHEPARVVVHDGERRLSLQPVSVYSPATTGEAAGDRRVRAPMPGRVVIVRIKPGDTVAAGQELLVMEAMKMELALKAPREGVVAEVRAAAGEFVEADAVMVTLE
jgi:3-methylcrotonyl-CoA carboxylase alpha subunit